MEREIENIGRNRIEAMNLGSEWLTILNGLYNRDRTISLTYDIHVTNEIIRSILQDNPGLFWFEGKWNHIKINDKEYIEPIYKDEGMDANKIEDQFNHSIKEIDKLIMNRNYSSYEIALCVYKWMLVNVNYGNLVSLSGGQNVYDTLVKKEAVCKGISKAYQLLLTRYGVPATLASGTIDGKSRHVWNVIKLDKYYNVDICMDYPAFEYLFPIQAGKQYKGFLLSDSEMRDTHNWDAGYPFRIRCD